LVKAQAPAECVIVSLRETRGSDPSRPSREPKVGDHVLVRLSGGRIVDTTEGVRLQVDFGYEETALIYDWQVVEEGR
jgi:hypothetical protein